jgi:hypothetical protein
VIIDEAAGVSEETFRAVRSILTGTGAKLLIIGNPTSMSGTFREAFHDKSDRWHTITIRADETPNFTAYGITREDMERNTWREKVTGPMPYPALIDPEYVSIEIEENGVDHPDVKARVWAEWPTEGAHTLISISDVDRAADADEWNDAGGYFAGVDVARFGSDETVISLRKGELLIGWRAWSNADEDASADVIEEFFRDVRSSYPEIGDPGKSVEIRVDVTGLGGGLATILKSRGYKVVEVNFAGASSDSEKWPNIRHEMWWQLAKRFEDGRIKSPHAIDPKLRSQLSDIKYTYRGRWTMPYIESKEEATKRGRKSPDRAESLMLAFANLPRKTRLPSVGMKSLGGAVAKTSISKNR